MPNTAFEEKYNERMNPNESKPVLGLRMKSCKKVISGELRSCPGMISRMRLYKPFSNSFEMGRYGISVNKKIMAGGIAITKLKEIAAALSFMPMVFIC